MKSFIYIFISMSYILQINYCTAKQNTNKLVIDDLVDIKDFKKILRTKTNILVCFYNNYKEAQTIIKSVKDVAKNIKGEGTLVLIDCSGEAKKMCKKLKIPNNEPFVLKHYKDGDFHKDYDRKLTVNSMTNFMRDPTGDLPWEEDSSALNVVHIPDASTLAKFIKKEAKPILVMFYAPWCGFCKSLKPEYAEAATELKDEVILAAIDVNRPENAMTRTHYNITGFPTMIYFVNGQPKYTYEGENKKAAIISFMRNPSAPPVVKQKEPEWSETDSEVVHLGSNSFDPVVKAEASVLVMFYAPWCGHCKKMKPEYEQAAAIMKKEGVPGMLAAVDATKEQSLASRYSVKGYPTVIYFEQGERRFDVNVREAARIVEFMREPREPPPPPPPERPWADEEAGDVIHLTEDNFKPFLRKKKHVLVIFYAPWCGHCKKTKPEFIEAAAKFRDDPKVEFAAVDCTIQQALCNANDVKGYPTLKYYSYYTKNTRVYNGGRTADDFVRFMLEPERLSNNKPPPAPENVSWFSDSTILHLTDRNFTQTVKKHKVMLVMFYAPWCGHCKRMKPHYIEAAKDLASQGYEQCMAMVDCTENPEVTEEYDISGFPTVKLFKNGKFVADYKGKRTPEDIKSFVLRHFSKDEL
ncbi:unnamed protein product [Callosobruchus maculatus]|uniref:Thioredoxin domain-containing protein n=1 Tax=Callosobruchus maculatus TaxID=64391 RepID=A0A653BYJ0_CALMS|nr:unnamed protein product [Callosobruchus maculatus]